MDIPASKPLGMLCISPVSATACDRMREAGCGQPGSRRRKKLCPRTVSAVDRLRVRLAGCGLSGVARNPERRAF
ncbi:hypothetical protein BDI4_900010 [Burkholderia diffusa]|nr:hypothetical protein BDI4_900010 [Burkholderia diffusa]